MSKGKQSPTPDPHEQVGSCTDNEGRDEENLDNLKTAWEWYAWARWGIDENE